MKLEITQKIKLQTLKLRSSESNSTGGAFQINCSRVLVVLRHAFLPFDGLRRLRRRRDVVALSRAGAPTRAAGVA